MRPQTWLLVPRVACMTARRQRRDAASYYPSRFAPSSSPQLIIATQYCLDGSTLRIRHAPRLVGCIRSAVEKQRSKDEKVPGYRCVLSPRGKRK
ncbi:hypothetical protein M3J09_008114 [Ascochyta lentis]